MNSIEWNNYCYTVSTQLQHVQTGPNKLSRSVVWTQLVQYMYLIWIMCYTYSTLSEEHGMRVQVPKLGATACLRPVSSDGQLNLLDRSRGAEEVAIFLSRFSQTSVDDSRHTQNRVCISNKCWRWCYSQSLGLETPEISEVSCSDLWGMGERVEADPNTIQIWDFSKFTDDP